MSPFYMSKHNDVSITPNQTGLGSALALHKTLWKCSRAGATTLLCIILIQRIGDSERTSASTNGLRPRCIAGPKYLRKLESQSNVRKTWSKDQSRSRRYGSQRSEDTGSEVWDVGESERDLDKRRTRVSSLH